MNLKREYTLTRKALMERVKYYERQGYKFNRESIILPSYSKIKNELDISLIEYMKSLKGEELKKLSEPAETDSFNSAIVQGFINYIIANAQYDNARDIALDKVNKFINENGISVASAIMYKYESEITEILDSFVYSSDEELIENNSQRLYEFLTEKIEGRGVSIHDRKSFESD